MICSLSPDGVPSMSEPPPVTAEIIAFPLRRSGPATDAGQERLQRALAALDEAVAGQRAAIAACGAAHWPT